ncbi:MAG: hypothetical protein K1X35_02770 [Caulobacteraceae bacterium]|nr:hypothetical protein [Caulobacteraceae bacterium]
MISRRNLAGLVAAGMAGSAPAATAQTPSSPGPRSREAAALRAFAETGHPRGRQAAADAAWRTQWDLFVERADRLGDGAFYAGVLKGLGWFKDGHTTAFPDDNRGAFALKAPFGVRAFDDGLYVVKARDSALPLLGGRLLAVNGTPDQEAMRRVAELWPGNNPAWGHVWGPRLLESAGGLQAVDLASDPAQTVQVEAEVEGRRVSASVRYAKDAGEGLRAASRTPSEREGWTAAFGRGNYVKPLPRSKAIYVSIDDMADLDGMTFADLTRELFAVMQRPGFERIILDLSRNGGGDNYLGEPLRKGLERSRFNRPGGLYVIVSPSTFSAAQNLTNRIERETYALFIGGPTGGAPNHYGDARPLRGEATGVTAIVSSLAWFDGYPQDERPWVLPDLPVPDTFDAWRSGRDLAIARALTHRPDAREPDPFAPQRIYYFRRASQAGAWKPWWRA